MDPCSLPLQISWLVYAYQHLLPWVLVFPGVSCRDIYVHQCHQLTGILKATFLSIMATRSNAHAWKWILLRNIIFVKCKMCCKIFRGWRGVSKANGNLKCISNWWMTIWWTVDGWVNGWVHVKPLKSNKSWPNRDNSIMDILDILFKPPQPLMGLFFSLGGYSRCIFPKDIL